MLSQTRDAIITNTFFDMSRYDADRFDPPPDPELICCICHSVLDTPQVSPCQHVYCKVCIETWLSQHNTCPTCRKRILPRGLKAVLPMVQNLINRLHIRCINYSNGCPQLVQLALLENHEKGCTYELRLCRFSRCGRKIPLKYLAAHESSECQYREHKCTGDCGLMVTWFEMEQHDCLDALKNRVKEQHQALSDLKKRLEELDGIKANLENQLKEEREKLSEAEHRAAPWVQAGLENPDLSDTFSGTEDSDSYVEGGYISPGVGTDFLGAPLASPDQGLDAFSDSDYEPPSASYRGQHSGSEDQVTTTGGVQEHDYDESTILLDDEDDDDAASSVAEVNSDYDPADIIPTNGQESYSDHPSDHHQPRDSESDSVYSEQYGYYSDNDADNENNDNQDSTNEASVYSDADTQEVVGTIDFPEEDPADDAEDARSEVSAHGHHDSRGSDDSGRNGDYIFNMSFSSSYNGNHEHCSVLSDGDLANSPVSPDPYPHSSYIDGADSAASVRDGCRTRSSDSNLTYTVIVAPVVPNPDRTDTVSHQTGYTDPLTESETENDRANCAEPALSTDRSTNHSNTHRDRNLLRSPPSQTDSGSVGWVSPGRHLAETLERLGEGHQASYSPASPDNISEYDNSSSDHYDASSGYDDTSDEEDHHGNQVSTVSYSYADHPELDTTSQPACQKRERSPDSDTVSQRLSKKRKMPPRF